MNTAIQLQQIEALLAGFLMPLFRITPFITALPVFNNNIPLPVRVYLSVWVAAIVSTNLAPEHLVHSLADITFLMVAQQILIGLALGFTLRLVYAAVEVGGYMIGQQMGLGFAALQDPINGAQVPHISRFYTIMATLLFLAIDGHLVLIRILVDSFTSLPVTGGTIPPEALQELAAWGGRIFTGAMVLSLPAVTALLLANVAFGVITRATPQLNILVVGFPVTLIIGFAIMLMGLPALAGSLHILLSRSLDMAARLVG